MPTPHLLLDQFPVEIIFNVFSYLSASDILRSFHDFSRYLRQCIRSYDQFKVNFKSIFKRDFDFIWRVLRPDQILTLTFSDDEETPGQIDYFFTLFPAFDQTFTRLEHLQLHNPDKLPHWSQLKCLHTLTVDFKRWPRYSFDYEQLKQFENNLINTFRIPTLQTLTVNNELLNIDCNFHVLPVAEQLHQFKVLIRSIDLLPTIFKSTPNIHRLNLILKSRSIENDCMSHFDAPQSLTHLTVRVAYGLCEEIKKIIEACKSLTHLNIHVERYQKDIDQWMDGNWWVRMIGEKLCKLKVFSLKIDVPDWFDKILLQQRLESFQTEFWANLSSFTIDIKPYDETTTISKQRIVSIHLPMTEMSNKALPDFPNVETIRLENKDDLSRHHIVSDIVELKQSMNDLSRLKHLQLDKLCSITPSVLNELLSIAPQLTRLTISSAKDDVNQLIQSTYPQIRWLDMKQEYVFSKFRAKFCSAFPNLEHLYNCRVYTEEDLAMLVENFKHLQSITVHNVTYYYDSDEEFEQWLTKHTALRDFTFKLIHPRLVHLWIVAVFLLLTFIAVVTQGKSASISPAVDYHLPDWEDTGSMNYARASHTSTLLVSGKVLVTGGVSNNTKYHDTAELYDIKSQTWTLTGKMNHPRVLHTATILEDGSVLVVGGSYLKAGLSSAELYNITTGTWTMTGKTSSPRFGHTASLLSNGKVLIIGGSNGTRFLKSAELYDPLTRVWTTTSSMRISRFDFTASVLTTGKVLIAGGVTDEDASGGNELYDPTTGDWTPVSNMNMQRFGHTASVLRNGKVLVAGGFNIDFTNTAELYDPSTDVWTNTGLLHQAQAFHTASTFKNGTILVTGGYGSSGHFSKYSEVYNSLTGSWMITDSVDHPRYEHSTTVLPSGKVLMSGGIDSNSIYLNSAELL
ncbi:unnamed protein product [Adineta ricciae]|uniref:F-box domain-containing protein n=1 Tax=Adineta ricciae TaxID=249248 RepID=A0A813YZS9_ADIRI|nr:unnamed protein product [Adineta ricciae]